jgi:hypothetical protein
MTCGYWLYSNATDTHRSDGRPNFASGIQNSRARIKLDQDRSLTLLRCSTRRFRATDPRDKIFSLLGLAKAHQDGGLGNNDKYSNYSRLH